MNIFSEIDRKAIVAFSRTRYNLPMIFTSKLDITNTEILNSEIIVVGGTIVTREIERNALVFNLSGNGFGLLTPGTPNRGKSGTVFDKSKVSIYCMLHVNAGDVAVFNRAEVNDTNYVQAVIRSGASGYNLQIQKVVDNVHTVLSTESGAPITPYAPVEFEFYADLENDVCGVVKRGIVDSGIFSSLRATIGGIGGATTFRNVLIGFQNLDSVDRLGIIYMPVIVMSN